MTLPLAWMAPTAPTGPVVALVPQAAYHLAELVPLRDELRARGVAAELLALPPHRKPLHGLRPAVRRHREMLAAAGTPMGPVTTLDDVVATLRGLVVLNDWGVPRPLVVAAQGRGVPTYGWVEGVQDFDDVDGPRPRHPYRSVDHVFCLGPHSAAALADRPTTIVGSARLRAAWDGPPASPPRPHATVNSNFTYGVLTEARRPWLASVRTACERAGIDWTLSRHAAERSGPGWSRRSSREPVESLLARSTHLVSRFSTVCYEALVRGVELCYHNPHGERVPTFADPQGGFVVTRSADELAEALGRPPRSPEAVRAGARDFLDAHLRLDPGRSPAELAADVIAGS